MLASSSQLLWYTTRATGVVALILLTTSVVLGVLTVGSLWYSAVAPLHSSRPAQASIASVDRLHLLAHIVTAVSDSFAPIGWISVFVPFTSPYRRLWLGLGTAAVDLLLAVTVTSLLRHKINARLWRGIHWLTYASWPLALLHGLGTGTDPHLEWMVILTVTCVVAVVIAIGWRLVEGWPSRAGARVIAGTASLAAVVALAAWTATGPLRPGWAARAGTPAGLLAGRNNTSATTPPGSSAPASNSGAVTPSSSSAL